MTFLFFRRLPAALRRADGGVIGRDNRFPPEKNNVYGMESKIKTTTSKRASLKTEHQPTGCHPVFLEPRAPKSGSKTSRGCRLASEGEQLSRRLSWLWMRFKYGATIGAVRFSHPRRVKAAAHASEILTRCRRLLLAPEVASPLPSPRRSLSP